jgi:hypothetical protein
MSHAVLKWIAPGVAVLLSTFGVLYTGSAVAAPTVSLSPNNAGIGSINVSVVDTTITIEEFWTSAAPGFLQISGLEDGVDYTVHKIIHNNSGIAWTRLANELLDPAGQPNDSLDVLPYPAFVPAGFTTSNDADGLSFAQGAPIPRSSTVFASVFADEDTDVRDFLDFFNGTLANGAVDDFMSFGLRDFQPENNEPFLLAQRPNASSRTSEPVPEPTAFLLLASGLAGVVFIWRRATAA